MVTGFAVYALIVEYCGWHSPPHWLVLSPAGLLILVPVTMTPQWFMGASNAGFGPDISMGILPTPHILFYYALIFGFGGQTEGKRQRTAALQDASRPIRSRANIHRCRHADAAGEQVRELEILVAEAVLGEVADEFLAPSSETRRYTPVPGWAAFERGVLLVRKQFFL